MGFSRKEYIKYTIFWFPSKPRFYLVWRWKMNNVDIQRELKKMRDNPLYFIDNYTNLKLFWYQKQLLKIIYSKPLYNAVLKNRNILWIS